MTATQLAWGAAAVVVGYFIGAINPAAIIARARGIDLRASGSGNPGATNAARVMGKRTGIIVGILDVLKGVIPALAFSLLVDPATGALAGFAAIVGHMTSPFLHGRGGKGVATTLGVILALHPLWLIPTLAMFGIVFAITKRTGIASVFGALALIATALINHTSWPLSILIVLIGLLVIFRHRRNIREAWLDLLRSHPQRSAN